MLCLKLGTVLAEVKIVSDEATIFSRRPWRLDEDAILAVLDEKGRVPTSIKIGGWEYFLEVAVAKEVLEVFEGPAPTAEECAMLLLFYAENDAFPEWVYKR